MEFQGERDSLSLALREKETLSMARLCEHAPITSAVMLQSAPIHSAGCHYRMYENLIWYGMKLGRITTNKMNSIAIPIWSCVLARNAVRRAENGVRNKDKVSFFCSSIDVTAFRRTSCFNSTVATHVASSAIVGSIFDANQ